MIRKTKQYQRLVRNYKGNLEPSEFASFQDILNKLYYYEQLEQKEAIMELSTGFWIKYSYDDRHVCSHCGSLTRVPDIEFKPAYKFCPYCNAKMIGRRYLR